mgnify:FL=1
MPEKIMDIPEDMKGRVKHRAYSRWNLLHKRVHLNPDVYGTITICDEWYTYSKFKAWLTSHDDWENKHMDKDLLVPGNRHYGPDVCLLLPTAINYFIVDGKSDHLPGVSYCPKRNKSKPWFARRRYTEDGVKKVQNLGYFLTELKGHLAWKEAKHKQACRLAEGIQDQRIASALRTRYL